MEGLIDIVLNNPFLLILILGGIFSLFSGKSAKNKENQEEAQRQPQQQSETRQESRERQVPEPVPARNVPMPDRNKLEEIQQQIESTLSVDEQRKEQIKQLTKEPNNLAEKAKVAADKRRIKEIQKVSASHNEDFQTDFNNSLTHKGLINSVIMAEVLGSPRARRPYESIIIKRKIR